MSTEFSIKNKQDAFLKDAFQKQRANWNSLHDFEENLDDVANLASAKLPSYSRLFTDLNTKVQKLREERAMFESPAR